MQGVFVEAHLVIRLDQLADAGRERLELIAREPPQGRDDHRDQGQAQLGTQGVHHRQDLLDLDDQRRLRIRGEPVELRRLQGAGIALDQQGEDDGSGAVGLIGHRLERIGYRCQYGRGVGELPGIDGPDPADHLRGVEAEDAAAGPDLRPDRRRAAELGRGRFRRSHADLRKVAFERGIDPTDSLDERGMGGEHPKEMADGVAEEQVTRLLGLGAADAGTLGQRADLLERPGDPVRIARELDGRGIRQELALAAHRRLDQVAEEHPDIAQHVQRQADQRPGIRPSSFAVATVIEPVGIGGRTEDDPAGHADQEDAVEHADQADVEPHVPVEDVAELVRDHALEFVAGEVLDAAASDADDGVARRVSRCERVDPVLALEQVHRRHRSTGRDRHLLDDVQDLSLVGIGRLGREGAPSHHLGYAMAAAGQRGDPVHAAAADQGQRPQRHRREQAGVPEIDPGMQLRALARAREEQGRRDDGIAQEDDRHHRDDEVDNQEAGLAPRRLLVLKEVHRIFPPPVTRHPSPATRTIRMPPEAPRAPWAIRPRRAGPGRIRSCPPRDYSGISGCRCYTR